MNISDVMDSKIKSLNDTVSQLLESNLSDKQNLEASLVLIDEYKKILLDEDLIVNADFSNLLEFLRNQNIDVDKFSKTLQEIQQVINVKKLVNMPDLSFSESQVTSLNELKTHLDTLKNDISTKLEEINTHNVNQDSIQNLEDLKKILTNSGKKKYYTEEMFEAFSNTVDWNGISDEEFDIIINSFYKTRNLHGKQSREIEDFNNIVELYKDFLDEKEFDENREGNFIHLLKEYQKLVEVYIDLDNSREILEFFKEINILNRFGRNALLKVSLFADSEYVKELYNKIMEEYPDELEIYFEDITATLWICNEVNVKKRKFRTGKGESDKDKNYNFYSQCHQTTEEEFRRNVDYLRKNADLFEDKFDVGNFGAHLKTKLMDPVELDYFTSLLKTVTSSTWDFRKNIDLFNQFNFGDFYKIPISALDHGNLENKIHLGIELGLLNPPMDIYSLEGEKDINNSGRFLKNSTHSKLSNNSIRDYFKRYVSVLALYDINSLGFLAYKLDKLGQTEFYNYFFHERLTGRRDKENIDRDMERLVDDKNQFIMDNFITDFYNQYIDKYDEYDVIISNYNDSLKLADNEGVPYFDDSILDDELIKELEDNYTITDSLVSGDDIVEIKSNFHYKFGNQLISRYKVLHNADILKKEYGYLDKDMLLTSIVRNSFLSENSFNDIKDAVMKREMNK